MSEMNILHIYDGHEQVYNGRGSVPTVVWNLAERSAHTDHNVSIIERRWEGLNKRATHSGVNFTRLDLSIGSNSPWTDIPYEMVESPIGIAKLLSSRLEFALKTRTIVKEMNPDIIHYHLPFAANYLTYLLPQYRDQMVYTAHLGETDKRVTDSLLSPDVFLAKRTAATTVLNEDMKAAFSKRGVQESKLYTIPNGVNTKNFNPSASNDSECFLILFVGTVTPRKRVIDLVEAAAEISDIKSQFVVAGKNDIDPEYYNEVLDRISKYGLEDRFKFTGFISNERIQSLYSQADIFVLPSQEEGFGMVVTEAMAAETPVIGTHVGGIPLQIEDGVNGYLYKTGDVDALTTKLSMLLQDPHLREEMGEKGREIAIEKFSWNAITDRFMDVYRRTLN